MSNVDSTTIDVLNDLLKNAHDGAQSYRVGAEEVQSLQLKQRFAAMVVYHEETARELASLVTAHGGEPVDGGTLSGALHRGWLKVKTAVGADSDLSILEEAERGEDGNLGRYRKALKETLPADIEAIVNRLALNAQKSHDEIKVLRDQARSNQSALR